MNQRKGKRKRKNNLANPASQNAPQGDPQSPASAGAHQRPPQSCNSDETSAQADKRSHTALEKTGFAVAILALFATGWQGWVARDSEQRQLRAYLHPIIDEESVDLDKNPMEWTYWLKNYGQTPACHVRTSGQLIPAKPDFGFGQKPDVINHYGTEPSYCIAPQEKHRVVLYFSLNHPDAKLNDTEKDMIKWGAALLLFAHGTIYYDDIWGEPHVTDYRTAFGGNVTMRTGKMDWTAEGNGTH